VLDDAKICIEGDLCLILSEPCTMCNSLQAAAFNMQLVWSNSCDEITIKFISVKQKSCLHRQTMNDVSREWTKYANRPRMNLTEKGVTFLAHPVGYDHVVLRIGTMISGRDWTRSVIHAYRIIIPQSPCIWCTTRLYLLTYLYNTCTYFATQLLISLAYCLVPIACRCALKWSVGRLPVLRAKKTQHHRPPIPRSTRPPTEVSVCPWRHPWRSLRVSNSTWWGHAAVQAWPQQICGLAGYVGRAWSSNSV